MTYLNRGHSSGFMLLGWSSACCLPNDRVYVPGLGGEDTGITEPNVVSLTDAALYHSLSVHIVKTYIPVVLCNPGVN
jgi:hypothetical protein